MEFQDKYYLDLSGNLIFMSAEDHENAIINGHNLPDPSWVEATPDQVQAIQNPQPTLAEAQAMQTKKISDACSAYIYAGFSSSALGSSYHYPAQDKDQQNLTASVLDSTLPDLPAGWVTPFWCQDAAGEWAFRSHTAAQIQQVGRDGKTRILAAMAQNVSLTAQVAAAATVEAVAAVVWSDPE